MNPSTRTEAFFWLLLVQYIQKVLSYFPIVSLGNIHRQSFVLPRVQDGHNLVHGVRGHLNHELHLKILLLEDYNGDNIGLYIFTSLLLDIFCGNLFFCLSGCDH